MSLQKRKIAYYSIAFINGDDKFFDAQLFYDFLKYVNTISGSDRIFNDTINKKATDFDAIRFETKEGLSLVKVAFKSCKYQHSPDYMSSVDGSERASDKQLVEGEKELTHMCVSIKTDEAYTIFEQRKNGVSIGAVIKYLNSLLHKFLSDRAQEEHFSLFAYLIPPKDFLDLLNDAERILRAEIFVEKEVLGSGYLNFMDVNADVQDELIISTKAKRGESLPKRSLKNAFFAIATEGVSPRRIRLYAKDIDKLDIIIDSLGKKKVDEITVELNDNGTVNSYSIFAKLEELMGVTE